MSHLKLKIGCTPEELKKAQRLRYDVFDLEIDTTSGSPDPNGLDQDEFDPVCEHLLIIDTQKDMVIGTYRMLLDTAAQKNFGFYTETKFNIDNFKRLDGRLLEVGRSCVHKDYRNRSVLNLLWHGIVQYAMTYRVRYIFGMANIMTNDLRALNEFFSMFKALGLYEDMGVTARHKNETFPIDENIRVKNPERIFVNLPTLFKGYMQVGLKVCGYPVQGNFNTAVFPVLLDIKKVNKIYRKHFLGDYLLEDDLSLQQIPAR